ncbi:Tyrosine-tRNA ligase-like protein [Quillaja saponaria]|nr:Tyrosine-tRNA ligase-like protein [Quillaja saponaria]
MSKSDPSSSIFMEDDEAEVNLKIKKAYCPPKIVQGNPCLEYIKYLILPWFKEFKVERSVENGGDKAFKSYEGLIASYESGELHPGDLKPSLSKALNTVLEPVREHFKKDANARDLLKRIKAYRVTK